MSERKIRFATREDHEAIRQFLHDHWDAEFSVVRSKALFDYLYLDGDRINFLIALDGPRIVACLGVSPYHGDGSDAFFSLWRSIDKNLSTGIDLIRYATTLGFRSLNAVGVRKEVLVIYKMLGFKYGCMDHFLRIAPGKNAFTILQPGGAKAAPLGVPSANTQLEEVSTFDPEFSYFEEYAAASPFKPRSYLDKRYFAHPCYQYRIWELRRDNVVENYFVTRTVTHAGASALRLVDCIADDAGFVDFMGHLDKVLVSEGHEYIDFYTLNFNIAALESSGFTDSATLIGTVVPNYFEPFIQQGEVKYYVTTLDQPCLYKGDGDMDRPYRLQTENA